jgi:hypothetical protein
MSKKIIPLSHAKDSGGFLKKYNELQYYSSTGLSQRSASSNGIFFLVA